MSSFLKHLFCLFILLIALSACGGGGGSGGSDDGSIDTITINMSPLRITGFSDDGISDPLHPIVDMGTIPNGNIVLLRVRDVYGEGGFYSIKVRNGFGEEATGTPAADEGEPDNSPNEAAVLTFGDYEDRGLDPVFDEDWFSFTASGGECCHYASTRSNGSGNTADPILEVYDPVPDHGPVTFRHSVSNDIDQTLVRGVFDPVSDFTLIAMKRYNPFDQLDKNEFYIVFSGQPTPGDYPVYFAAPPIPDDVPDAVTGTIYIDQYDDVGGRIIGGFNLTITDVSRTSTVEGNFNVTRVQNEAGLLTGLKTSPSPMSSQSLMTLFKDVSAYMIFE